MSPRPPEASCWTRFSWAEMSPAVTPSACIRALSRSTWTSRSTPPTRATRPTPLIARSDLEISLSTNQESSCSSIRSEPTVKVTMAEPVVVTLETTGSVRSWGRSARTLSTALRTSFRATSGSLSIWNSTRMLAEPSVMVVRMCSMPPRLATLSSILRATSVSSWVGSAPSRLATMVTVGSSMSGKFWMPRALKPMTPSMVNRANSRMAGTG